MTPPIVVALLGLAVALAPQAPRPVVMGWIHHGTVRIDARTRFGGFSGTTEAVTGKITETDSAGRPVGAWVEVLARSFVTGNRLRDADVRRTLAVDRHPTMRFDLDRLEGSGGAMTVHGTLRLHGVRRAVAVPVEASAGPDSLRVQASFPVDLREHGVTRFSRFLGLLRVEPTVTVSLDLVFEQARSHH